MAAVAMYVDRLGRWQSLTPGAVEPIPCRCLSLPLSAADVQNGVRARVQVLPTCPQHVDTLSPECAAWLLAEHRAATAAVAFDHPYFRHEYAAEMRARVLRYQKDAT